MSDGPFVAIARGLHSLWDSFLIGIGSIYYKVLGRH